MKKVKRDSEYLYATIDLWNNELITGIYDSIEEMAKANNVKARTVKCKIAHAEKSGCKTKYIRIKMKDDL